MNNRIKLIIFQIFGLILIFIVWQIGSSIVSLSFEKGNIIFPSIKETFTKAYPEISYYRDTGMVNMGKTSYLIATKVLLTQLLVTSRRVLLGGFLGLTIGIGTGLLISRFNKFHKSIILVLDIIRQIPLLSLSILFILWFGGREIGTYLFIAYGVSVMIVVNTINSLNNVNPVYIKFAKTLGASNNHIYRTVMIPAIIPSLVGGIRVIFGVIWSMTIAAEYLAAPNGLGRILINAEYFSATGRMIVATIFIIIIAYLSEAGVKALLYRIIRWSPKFIHK